MLRAIWQPQEDLILFGVSLSPIEPNITVKPKQILFSMLFYDLIFFN